MNIRSNILILFFAVNLFGYIQNVVGDSYSDISASNIANLEVEYESDLDSYSLNLGKPKMFKKAKDLNALSSSKKIIENWNRKLTKSLYLSLYA